MTKAYDTYTESNGQLILKKIQNIYKNLFD